MNLRLLFHAAKTTADNPSVFTGYLLVHYRHKFVCAWLVKSYTDAGKNLTGFLSLSAEMFLDHHSPKCHLLRV